MASKEPVVMLSEHFLHMNGANEECSYATNSSLQNFSIRKVKPILKKVIEGIGNVDGFPQCFNVADFGCSTGPNTLLVISNIINEVHEVCKEMNLKIPHFHVCLNDLYGNDFNSIFKSLPMFYANHKKDKGENFGPCFISAVPGSFHGRLFPDQSMHFFHSSSSLHWLSQVPKGVENNGLNVHLAKTSPPNVFEMYKMQFEKDFTTFLESRSCELTRGGHMFFSIGGRNDVDPTSSGTSCLWELMAKSLVDMLNEGLVRKSDINSFNVPIYHPYKDEVIDLIRNQGSFSLDIIESFQLNWDPCDNNYGESKVSNDPGSGKRVAKVVRAASEPMLITYFGNSSMDLIFQKFEKYVDELPSAEKTKHLIIVIALTKI